MGSNFLSLCSYTCFGGTSALPVSTCLRQLNFRGNVSLIGDALPRGCLRGRLRGKQVLSP